MRTIAIFGAYSAIAEATARALLRPGARYALIGRNADRLRSVADDLTVRGAGEVFVYPCDLTETARLAELIDAVFGALGRIDIALLAHGTLPDQTACEESIDAALDAFRVNALSHIALLTLLAGRFAAQGGGTIAVLTSVAGDRGRRSNYVYGAAKKAVSTVLEGLRQRLAPAGVRIVDIRPGFVDTPMTAAFEKGPLWSDPATVAAGIVWAIERGTPVAYVPWFWRLIMAVVRALPRALFDRVFGRATG